MATKITSVTTYECGHTETAQVYPVGKTPEKRTVKMPCNDCLESRQSAYVRKDKFVDGCTACTLVKDGYHEYEHAHNA